MKIELYLNNNPVQIDKDIDFVLNKQFTNLTDLTSIIVDYTKTIKIPMTPDNNSVFNYVYKLEHVRIMNEDIVSYDPSQKIDMYMLFNGSVVMEGYAVLNNVNTKEKYYEINLYGQLGSIFNVMKEKVLKDYTKFDNGWWKELTMNINSIRSSFYHTTRDLNWESNDWNDFFGFAPQVIGKSDSMNTTGYEVYGTGEIKTFVDDINTARGITYAENYVKDGFDFNQYQEIRSYMTRPYVYVDKLIHLVRNEINTDSKNEFNGYKLVLDEDWFNSENPYYANLCFFPGNESPVDSGESVNGSVTWDNSERTLYFPMSFRPSTTAVDLEDYSYVTGDDYLISITGGISSASASLSLNCDGIVVRDRVTGVGSTSGFNSDGKWAYYNLPNSYRVPIRYIGIFDSENNLIYKLYLCDNTIHSVYKDTGFLKYSWSHHEYGNIWNKLKKLSSKVIVPNSCVWVNGSSNNNYCEVTQTYNFGNIVLPTNSFKFKMGCDIIDLTYDNIVSENISTSSYHTLCPFKNNKYKKEVWDNGATWSSYFRPIQSLSLSSNNYRSGSKWTINDILGYDFNPFKWLIDYVKKFRLFFDIDYNTRIITLKSGYFNNVTYNHIVVDYSKDVIVEPIVDRYYSYNYGYKGNNSKKNIKYRKNYGINYGDIDVSTGIKLNNDNMSLIPDEEESVFIPTEMSCLTYNNLVSTGPIRYYNPLFTNHVINTLDKDGKIEYYPFYAFRWGNMINPVQPRVPFYWVSDDTPNQKNSGEYTYLAHTTNWVNDGYLDHLMAIPQFDNYIPKTVTVTNRSIIPTSGLMSVQENVELEGGDEQVSYETPEISEEYAETEAEDVYVSEYTDPVTGQRRSVRRSGGIVYEDLDPETGEANETQTYIYWCTFNVPAEVYNGYVPSNIENYCIRNRWLNYIEKEIFNVDNKKVTCYVRMTYPEFISFKFNHLFVIENSVFLVNKIIDFNPNSQEPTKVELLQISDVENLK